MNCLTSCNVCNKFIKSTNITFAGSTLTITIPSTISLVNLREYCLVLCQSIPSAAGTSKVVITNGTTTYNVYCRKGNFLRADQLRSRRKYCITYGTDPVHIEFLSPVCPTAYVPSKVTEPDKSVEGES